MAGRQAIRLALGALAAARIDRWLPVGPDVAGVVLTLHHVEPPRPSQFAPNAHLSITPDFLDRLIARLQARGFRFVPVSELIEPGDGDPRRVAVTLDDGFRDNRQHALPVFRRRSVPFALYVCPGFCDRTAELWWEALERIIAATESLSLDGAGPPGTLRTGTPAEKRRAFRLWAGWLSAEADERKQREIIRRLAEKYRLDLAALAAELVMDWDEVRAIAADPLCTIGAHTMTHPALGRLPADGAFREMQESADRIAAEIGMRPATIAFPYGHAAAATAREADLARQAGFAASFTTRPGTVPVHGSRHGLPRISVNGLYQDLRLLEVLVTPGLWSLKSRLRPQT
jgi:peptidoglycan/xylan/chitin deacetylase (PgdA/CDA1 family)